MSEDKVLLVERDGKRLILKCAFCGKLMSIEIDKLKEILNKK